MTEEFKDMVTLIKGRVGDSLQGLYWLYSLLEIVEERDTVLRIKVSFQLGEHIIEKELKLVEINFSSISHYDVEIERQLAKLDAYTEAKEYIKAIATVNADKGPEITDQWGAFLIGIVEETAGSCVTRFVFHRKVTEVESFIKDFSLGADSFQSLEFYLEELARLTAQLNTPPNISVTYYSSLITQNTY